MAKILVIEDEPNIRQLVKTVLELNHYEVLTAESGQQGLALARDDQPDLVLLDVNLPDIDGFEVSRSLRQSIPLAHVPIVMLTAKAAIADKLVGFSVGADDYVTKPFDMDELLARVGAHLRRVEQGLLSELTGLPGNTQIERAIQRLIKTVEAKWAILYIDLDQFKAFNDVYGFVAGNELIKATARILQETVRDLSRRSDLDFVGHIGGDDFVVITSAEQAEELCRAIIDRFDAQAPLHYPLADRHRGYIVAVNRQGRRQRFPLVSISIAVVTNRHRHISSHFEVGAIAAQVKQKAKSLRGSSYQVDRRTSA